jgi:hypothetical protein
MSLGIWVRDWDAVDRLQNVMYKYILHYEVTVNTYKKQQQFKSVTLPDISLTPKYINIRALTFGRTLITIVTYQLSAIWWSSWI